jgi:polyisoprenoid-binding protein YceI
MMISHVRGGFHAVRATLTLNSGDVAQSAVVAEIEAASIETGDQQRDADLRGTNFLDVERFPAIFFRSTKIVEHAAGTFRVEGDLTIHGVTRNAGLDVEGVSSPVKDPWGNLRMAASARTVIHRKDFGLTWNAALETGGVLVGDDVAIEIELEFVRSREA